MATPEGGSPSHAESNAPRSQPESSTDSNEAANRRSVPENTKDHVHISLNGEIVTHSLRILYSRRLGVHTVDDLLDRIDQAVESANIVVDVGKDTTARTDESNPTKPHASAADVEKKPIAKETTTAKIEPNADQKDEQEPIRINCNDIRTIEDLLEKVNEQPGSRKLTLENLPNNAETLTMQKRNSSVNPVVTKQSNVGETTDALTAPKSVLKTSHDPSSSDTSTKTASFQDDQIHLKLDGVHNINELLDRVDDKVQHLPVIIDGGPQENKRQGSITPSH